MEHVIVLVGPGGRIRLAAAEVRKEAQKSLVGVCSQMELAVTADPASASASDSFFFPVSLGFPG